MPARGVRRIRTAAGAPPYFSAFPTRFCTQERSRAGSPRDHPRFVTVLEHDGRVRVVAAGAGDHLCDNRPQVHVHDGGDAAAAIQGSELQHPFDGVGHAPRFVANDPAVPPHPGRIGDQPVREISSGKIDGRDRRAHLVRDAGDELELLSPEALRLPRVRDNHPDRHRHEQQNPEAEGKVARPELRHGGRERARAMPGHQPPPLGTGPRGGSMFPPRDLVPA